MIRVETTFFLVPQFLKILRLCIIMLRISVLICSQTLNVSIFNLFINPEKGSFNQKGPSKN